MMSITSYAYKHYSGSGTGLRTLMDFYAYLNAKGDTFNLDYIRTECKNIGIICFVGCGESGGTEIQCRVVGHKSY